MEEFSFDSLRDEMEHYFDIRIEYTQEQVRNNRNNFANNAKISLARTIKRDVLKIIDRWKDGD